MEEVGAKMFECYNKVLPFLKENQAILDRLAAREYKDCVFYEWVVFAILALAALLAAWVLWAMLDTQYHRKVARYLGGKCLTKPSVLLQPRFTACACAILALAVVTYIYPEGAGESCRAKSADKAARTATDALCK